MDGAIVTYTGKAIEPLNPDPALICIEDIAHSLSNVCRFTGHTRFFYSVAQHSVLASRMVPHEHALTALLHDASEAYLSDFARPIKQQPEFGDVYRVIEERLMLAIVVRFGIEWPMPPAVKHADEVLLRTEQRDLMPPLLRFPGDEYLDEKIAPWPPSHAELAFRHRFDRLTIERAAA